MRRIALGVAICVMPGATSAHSAFGDLGPFYASLLHPLADASQGLLLAGVAVLLATQPIATVRPALTTLAVVGALAVVVNWLTAMPPPGLRFVAVASLGLALLALTRARIGAPAGAAIAAAAAIAAGLAFDLPSGLRAASIAALGGAVGMALFTLLVWGIVDLARRRLGPVAGAVAASWVAAIGLMAAILPSA